jgi:hypothetical protein
MMKFSWIIQFVIAFVFAAVFLEFFPAFNTVFRFMQPTGLGALTNIIVIAIPYAMCTGSFFVIIQIAKGQLSGGNG